MAIITTYKCDKCGREWQGKEVQPVAIGLMVQFGNMSCTSGYPTKSAMWCRECVMREGLSVPHTDDDKKVSPSVLPTFEDAVIALFRDLGFVHQAD